jgi:hypothetical protein
MAAKAEPTGRNSPRAAGVVDDEQLVEQRSAERSRCISEVTSTSISMSAGWKG